MKLQQILLERPHNSIDTTIFPSEFQQQFPMLSRPNTDGVDLGFENLGLPSMKVNAYEQAFRQNGVRIPNSQYKLQNGSSLQIIPHTGTEPELPPNWIQGVLTWDKFNVYIWIGIKVRQGDYGGQIKSNFDFSPYSKLSDGWLLQ